MPPKKLKKINRFPNSFIGDEPCSLDSRGRTIFPAKFRHMISPRAGECLVIAPGKDGCLIAVPRDAWEVEQSKFDFSPYADPVTLKEQRRRFHFAFDVPLESQGRITIPVQLLEKAKIEKDMVIVGMPGRFEIWEPGVLAEYRRNLEEATS